MADLDDVGHGSVVAGRYRLEDRVRVTPHGSTWRAVDTTLERPVLLLLHAGPHHEDVLDAARRASVVEDARLQRVLDAGSVAPADDDGVYVVTELTGGRTLAERVHEGPLPAAQARAVVGEAAAALERAGRGGLHHLRLTPDSLLLSRDSAVTVTGTAVEAAAHGTETEDSAAADRADAVALVAVLYAALTGLWPRDDPGGADAGGLPEAPRVEGLPVPPADLVAAVPNDLDTLCSVTLGGHDDGPRSPAELARELAPWGRSTIPEEPAHDALPMRPPGRFPVSLAVASLAGASLAGGAPAAAPTAEPAAAPHLAAHRAAGPPGDDPVASAEWDPPEAPDRGHRGGSRQTLVVFAVITALVLAGLWFAVDALRSPGTAQGGDRAASTAPATEPGTAAEPSASPEATPSATPTPPPPVISGVRTLDPEGDGVENDETAAQAVDDDPESAWQSSTYTTAEFGNLKDGVGLVVVLRDRAQVSGATLDVAGSGGRVELRVAPGAGLEESRVVAAAEPASGTVDLTPDEPVETQNLVLWFTDLPQVGGSYRIELQQVQVR